MFGRLNLFYFSLAFAIGLFVCYVITPPPEMVLKHPSPYNAGKVTYKDKADTCYKYRADKVACPLDRSSVLPQPILEDYVNRRQTSLAGPATIIASVE
jgi:hypothetical protein